MPKAPGKRPPRPAGHAPALPLPTPEGPGTGLHSHRRTRRGRALRPCEEMAPRRGMARLQKPHTPRKGRPRPDGRRRPTRGHRGSPPTHARCRLVGCKEKRADGWTVGRQVLERSCRCPLSGSTGGSCPGTAPPTTPPAGPRAPRLHNPSPTRRREVRLLTASCPSCGRQTGGAAGCRLVRLSRDRGTGTEAERGDGPPSPC